MKVKHFTSALLSRQWEEEEDKGGSLFLIRLRKKNLLREKGDHRRSRKDQKMEHKMAP